MNLKGLSGFFKMAPKVNEECYVSQTCMFKSNGAFHMVNKNKHQHIFVFVSIMVQNIEVN